MSAETQICTNSRRESHSSSFLFERARLEKSVSLGAVRRERRERGASCCRLPTRNEMLIELAILAMRSSRLRSKAANERKRST